jgi:transcription initiation factor IIE alpha subunit
VELVFHCSTCGKPLVHCGNENFVEQLSLKVEQLRKELGE